MSYDLVVMNVDKPLSSEEATEIYYQLCEGTYDLLPPSEKIHLFYQELTDQYPDMDSYADGNIDDCPWSVEIDVSDGAILMCMVRPASDEIPDLVTDLADKYGLALYDPQVGSIYLPASIKYSA